MVGIIPKYEHMRDIIERGPAMGSEADAASRYLQLMIDAQAFSDQPRFSHTIRVYRDGQHVETISLVPCTEDVALARMNCAVLDYYDCDIRLLQEVDTSIPLMRGRVEIELASYSPEED